MSKARIIIAVLVCLLAVCSWLLFQLAGSGETQRTTTPIATFLSSTSDHQFAQVTADTVLQFPDDHSAHPDYRQEWWYFTGHLESSEGLRFGYQLTFFRFVQDPQQPTSDSAWHAEHAWMAHFALTDVDGESFYFADDFSRQSLGLAGSQATPFSVWVNGWSASSKAASCDQCLTLDLFAETPEVAIDLEVSSISPPVLQGERGFSQKNAAGTVASYYYSYPSMMSSGSVRIHERSFQVAGSSWMDREWSSAVLAKGQSGWDWFSLHLDAGTQLMLFQVREDNLVGFKSAHLMSASPDGNKLIEDEFLQLEPLQWWTSPATGVRYPLNWQLQSTKPGAEFELVVTPLIRNQELDLAFRYYEGAVSVQGSRDGRSVSGSGYMELTGYGETD